jgi:hypothetical protein
MVFEYKTTLCICVLVLWIHKGYYVVIKLVWIVRNKDFWITKNIMYKRFNFEHDQDSKNGFIGINKYCKLQIISDKQKVVKINIRHFCTLLFSCLRSNYFLWHVFCRAALKETYLQNIPEQTELLEEYKDKFLF